MDQEKIVGYWHAVELLQPQAAPKVKKRDSLHQPFFQTTPMMWPELPWSPGSNLSREHISSRHVWSHTLFAHLYDGLTVTNKLEELFGSEIGYREPLRRESALFSLKFNAKGEMVPDSLVLSSEAWFLGRAMAGREWKYGFEDDQNSVRLKAMENMGGIVDQEALIRLTTFVRKFLGLEEFFGDTQRRKHRFRSSPVNPRKQEQEDDPLNSFLLEDLYRVECSIKSGSTSLALDDYLSRHSDSGRFHLDEPSSARKIISLLSPAKYSPGCWPSEKHLGLVHSQQLAVNATLDALAGGAGVIGVNGPPGTGKTTLLRDLIASVVTSRADVLASLPRASDAFESSGSEKANDGGREQSIHKLNPKLFGFEIVVASANNGAVENITLELPQKDKIDECWLSEADYFADLAENLTELPAWGIISAALGTKAKRNKFVDRFFYGVKPKKSWAAKADATASGPYADQGAIEAAEEATELLADLESPEEVAEAKADQDKPKGFKGWLSAEADLHRPSDERQRLWRNAVAEYETAKRNAAAIGSPAGEITGLLNAFYQRLCEHRTQQALVAEFEAQLAKALLELKSFEDEEFAPAFSRYHQRADALALHQTTRPSFWQKIVTLWGAQKAWSATQKILSSSYEAAEYEVQMLRRKSKHLEEENSRLSITINQEGWVLDDTKAAVTVSRDAVALLAQEFGAAHLLTWLETDAIDQADAIELAEPWIIKDWRQARAKVFLAALKLHKTFFKLEAKRVRSNLQFVTSILSAGKYRGLTNDSVRSAWSTLFMAVPVLSSTFASFSRSFASLGASQIGWLLIDEAGQATPQAAVGAIWRSQRAVVVGDPLQLEPILTVSDAALEHMRTAFEVDPHWLPNHHSAQSLADQATGIGRMVGPRGSKRWVGLPLVVHRRCDRPMFEVANRIAYDGAMVYGTIAPSAAKQTTACLKTGWINATGPSTGNWVPAEGVALRALLDQLLQVDLVPVEDIAVITPFQDVRQQLKAILPKGMTSGTIHTMQGKESAVIVMVLGGSSTSDGARNWAVSKPNLLNVAATRAKQRFYVIGDREDWEGRALFCNVMDLLPALPCLAQAKAEEALEL